MSTLNITQYSLAFSGSKLVIIPVDSEFNPIEAQSKLFCMYYKKAYISCKEKFDPQEPKVAYSKLATNKHVLFVPVRFFANDKIYVIASYISRLYSIDNPIDVLEPSGWDLVSKLEDNIPYDLQVFRTVFAD